VFRNEKGVTLVEMLVALVVFLLISLALMQTALMSIDSNMVTALREEGVRVAEERMNGARSQQFTTAFDTLSGYSDIAPLNGCPSATFLGAFPSGQLVTRNVRSITNFPYCTNLTVTFPNPTNLSDAQVVVTVGWQWKGQDYSHSISTIRGKYQ
jgi:prepilin-type N-terminal cleavage/methylation domain-containing protein